MIGIVFEIQFESAKAQKVSYICYKKNVILGRAFQMEILSVNDYFWCADTILVKCILASFLLILFPGDIILGRVLLTLPKLLIRALLE